MQKQISEDTNNPTAYQVVKAFAAVENLDDEQALSEIPIVKRWREIRKSELPNTAEGEIALEKKHAQLLAKAEHFRVAIKMLERVLLKFKNELDQNPQLRKEIDFEISDFYATEDMYHHHVLLAAIRNAHMPEPKKEVERQEEREA